MSAEHLDEQLVDDLAPEDAPTDDEIAGYIAALSDTDEDVRQHAEKSPPPFRVNDLGSADWAGRKIKRAQAKIDEAQAWRDEIVAKADVALERERARHQPTIEFFEGHLADWLRREIAADTSKKPRASRELPCGVVVKRTPPGKQLVVEDEDALVDWLKDHHPELVESDIVWKWSKADVKKLADEDGRLVREFVDDSTGEKTEIEAKGARVETGEHGWKIDVGGGA